MDTNTITAERLAASVVAVPPLCRDANGHLDREQNTRLVRHIEAGGVNTLLYGGNANLYHVPLSEYGDLLEMLADIAAADTLVVPAVGPAFGLMMDQAAFLRDTDFPTAMVLPHQGITTSAGVETGVRRFVEAMGKPAVLYIKHLGFIDPAGAKRLVDDGLISWIKYAIVRDEPAEDPYLSQLVDLVDPNLIVSGIGEQPAIVHMRDFNVVSFTSGCVCVAPRLSQQMLGAIRAGDYDAAEQIRQTFRGLEDERNRVNPIRVLHEAVAMAGIADTGPIQPLLSALGDADRAAAGKAAKALLEIERSSAQQQAQQQ
ncbi:MAG: dihydrodipicolinate synthase family protein [Phycisphaera sp.]|nr:dihydrodipicolinate synthase family protein [Phycisphaera sp.]